MTLPDPLIKHLGCQPYADTYQAMQAFTLARQADTQDEVWLVQHPPVFTLGINGSDKHILTHSDIPVIKTDRGGQVTYHGPGQQMLYVLLNIKQRKLGVRQLVTMLEKTTIDLLQQYDIDSYAKPDAPGVYVNGNKIASLGLRIKRQSSYHGLSLNVDMDLSPFNMINPCGYEQLKMTQISDFTNPIEQDLIATQLTDCFLQRLLTR